MNNTISVRRNARAIKWPLVRWVQISVVGCLGILLVSGCESKAPIDAPAPIDSEAEMRSACRVHLSNISSSLESQNPKRHAELTFLALEFMNSASIPALRMCEDVFLEFADRQGAQPFLSILIDYGYRLGRVEGDLPEKNFDRFSRQLRKSLDDQTKNDELVVWLRSEDYRSYKAVPMNWGSGVAKLALSDYGRKSYAVGVLPIDFVVTLGHLKNCKVLLDLGTEAIFAALKQCEAFTDEAEDETSPNEDIPADLSAEIENLGNGIPAASVNCVAETKGGQIIEVVENIESMLACMHVPGSIPDSLMSYTSSGPSGSGSRPDEREPFDEVLEDYTCVMSGPSCADPVTTVIGSSDASTTTTQTTYSYVSDNNPNNTIEVTEWSQTTADEQNTEGTYVASETQDSTSYFLLDGDGEMTYEYTESKNDKSSSYTTYENGVRKETVSTDKDGKITKQTYDENGDPIGEPEVYDPDQSCDDDCGPVEPNAVNPLPWEDSCVRQKLDPRSGIYPAAPYGPLIYPSPIEDSDELPTCLIEMLEVDFGQACPPSVVLCKEPGQIDPVTCNCVASDGVPLPPPALGRCAQMRCPEQTLCNPQTGSCRGFGNGILFDLPAGPSLFELMELEPPQ